MEASKGGFKSEAIRSAKAAILVSSLNHHLRSINNHRDYQSERNVEELTREVEDLKIQLVVEKVKNKMMSRWRSWMEVVLLQILFVILIIAVCFVFVFTDD